MPSLHDQLIRFLSSAESYAHKPGSIEIVQTHASIVAIAPPLVFKVKKPVNFGFLDFSTLEKRHHFCEEEVRLNRRMCPLVYEGVIPITSEDGRMAFDGGGDTVEYAIRMKRLEPQFFLHRLIKANQVASSDIDRIVRKLVAFYESQPRPNTSITEWGQPEKIRISTNENFEQIRKYRGRYLSATAFEALSYHADFFLESRAITLDRRVADGRILDCHGDLRLGHVHLSPNRVCIYDCIEFSERFRYIDIANDIAFLAMELDFAEHPRLSDHLVRSMADRLSDPNLLEVIDFYKCYRAVVRGKVEAFRSEEPEVPDRDREKSADRSKRHFAQALRYSVAGSKPLVVVVIGRVGTGKTTVAEALSCDLGWTVLSSDRVRKEQAGLPLLERPSQDVRNQLYAKERTDAVYSHLSLEAITRGANLRGTILDATYGSSLRRAALKKQLGGANIRHVFVELTASKQTVKERLDTRGHDHPVVSDARLEDLDTIDSNFEEPRAGEHLPLFSVASDGDVKTTVADILKKLVSLATSG